ncbi:MAG TPA: hypothetical protein VFX39_03280, partial [Gemmatimonadaceae bacterium]|nr:hypothetical protein [Gemmatimonadaceae bacterium]
RPGAARSASGVGTPGVRYDSALFAGLRYRHVGPFRGGRVTTVTGVPGEPRTFYFGSTGGGIWKTTDAGKSWRNVSDGFLATASMGAIRVAPSNPNVVYAATGSDGLRSNVSIGLGVYRSDDAGKSWRFIGLPKAGQVGAVEIHPQNPDVAFVAAIGNPFAPNPERGVYRTRDGGANWERVLFVSDSTGAVDVEFNPANPNELYATMWRAERKPWTIISGAREGGVYKSTDGGSTWRKLERGLPRGLFGKADLAVSRANPERVYALIEAPPGEGGLYRSDDRGESWTLVNTEASLFTRPFYYINVDADPSNADRVFVGTEYFYVSTDGGRSFETLDTPHMDNHDVWINPDHPEIWIQANDGGVNVTLDDGRTWSTQYNQPTAEIYQVYVDDQFPYRLYGAQQDNSTLMIPSLPLASARPDDWMQQWEPSAGCETGPVMPHPTRRDVVYGACKGQFSRLNLVSGQEQHYWVGGEYLYGADPSQLKFRFQRVAPIEISPHDPRVIYHGSQFVHRTTDEGVTWETISPDLTANDPRGHEASGKPITLDVTGEEYWATLYAIEESPLERGVIWVGANDGPVHVTRDGGKTWANVTPKGLPPGGRVQSIEPSPHRKGSAYVSVLRYLLGDFQPYIYRTDDYGRTWTRLTTGKNGIPADQPTRVVREDPEREGLLYAGTEFGVFVSFDNGASWQGLQRNMPVTPITDMKVHRGDLVLSTQGRGFWILDDLSPLHQLRESVAASRVHLFMPDTAIRMRYPVTLGSKDQPEYPTPGAHIDYWLGEAPSAPLTLEIVDEQGKVVRSWRGASATNAANGATGATAANGAARPAQPQQRQGALPTTRGMHRFVWDLTSDAPGGGRRGGPVVPPGTYQARLSTGDWETRVPVVVVIDPRVAADGVTRADLVEQYELQHRVLAAMRDVSDLIQKVQDARRAAPEGSERAAKLAALERQLVTAPIRYSRPMLRDH